MVQGRRQNVQKPQLEDVLILQGPELPLANLKPRSHIAPVTMMRSGTCLQAPRAQHIQSSSTAGLVFSVRGEVSD